MATAQPRTDLVLNWSIKQGYFENVMYETVINQVNHVENHNIKLLKVLFGDLLHNSKVLSGDF